LTKNHLVLQVWGVSAASQPPAHRKKELDKKPIGNTLDRLLFYHNGISSDRFSRPVSLNSEIVWSFHLRLSRVVVLSVGKNVGCGRSYLFYCFFSGFVVVVVVSYELVL